LETLIPNFHHLYTGPVPVLRRSTLECCSDISGFGELVREVWLSGGSWERICREDSDHDGNSNGLEMGDPCCEWTPGAAPYRTWNLTHPHRYQENFTSPAFVSPKSCNSSASERAEWLDKTFLDFYWMTKGIGSSHISTPWQFAAWWLRNDDQFFLKIPLFTAMALMLYDWCSKRGLLRDLVGFGPAAVPGEEPDLSGFWRGVVFIVSYYHADVVSGLTHISFDFLPFYLPVFGGVARSFQYHHVHPRQAIEVPYFIMMTHLLLPAGLVSIALMAWKPRRSFRLFWFLMFTFGGIGSYSTHRWMHHHPEELPAWFRLLQGLGVLASHDRHRTHHENPTISFSQLTGKSDFLIDSFSRNFVSAYKFEFWTSILLLSYAVPFVCGREATHAKKPGTYVDVERASRTV